MMESVKKHMCKRMRESTEGISDVLNDLLDYRLYGFKHLLDSFANFADIKFNNLPVSFYDAVHNSSHLTFVQDDNTVEQYFCI